MSLTRDRSCLSWSKIAASPIEMRPGIRLASGRYVAVTDDVGNRIDRAQQLHERQQHSVLRRRKRNIIRTLKFDANRKIVAVLAPAPVGYAGMPRAQGAGHELQQLAVAADQQVGRHAQVANRCVVGMRVRIEPIRKQIDNAGSAEFSWRQADTVDNEQLDRHAGRTLIAVGRGDKARWLD